MSEHRRPVAAVNLRGLGLTPDQAGAALDAAERLAEATGLTVDSADDAIYRVVKGISPKPVYYPLDGPLHGREWTRAW
jgi:hypothetical protein